MEKCKSKFEIEIHRWVTRATSYKNNLIFFPKENCACCTSQCICLDLELFEKISKLHTSKENKVRVKVA